MTDSIRCWKKRVSTSSTPAARERTSHGTSPTAPVRPIQIGEIFSALEGINYKRAHSPQGEAVKLGTGQNAKMDRGQRAVEALDKNE